MFSKRFKIRWNHITIYQKDCFTLHQNSEIFPTIILRNNHDTNVMKETCPLVQTT